jgi:hypothetical protein
MRYTTSPDLFSSTVDSAQRSCKSSIGNDGVRSQVVKAPDCDSGIRGFDSLRAPQFNNQETSMAQPVKKPAPVSKSFRFEVLLVDSEEYQVAYGYSELVGDHCIVERWGNTDEPWFHSHPALTNSRLLALVTANMPGTDYEALIELGAKIGILLLRGDSLGVRTEDGLEVHVKHDVFTGETPPGFTADPNKWN